MIQKKCIFAAIFSYNGGGWPTAHCAPNPLQKGLKARPMSTQVDDAASPDNKKRIRKKVTI